MAKRKWDWDKLKAEFLAGKWLTVKEFLEEKGIPAGWAFDDKVKGWAKDKKEMSKKALERSTKEILKKDINDITSIRMRQARTARFMQLKGLATLREKEVESIEEARRLVTAGLKEEREALGIGSPRQQTLTQINIGGPKTNLDKMIEDLDYEGILKLIAELKRERVKRTRKKVASDSQPEASG